MVNHIRPQGISAHAHQTRHVALLCHVVVLWIRQHPEMGPIPFLQFQFQFQFLFKKIHQFQFQFQFLFCLTMINSNSNSNSRIGINWNWNWNWIPQLLGISPHVWQHHAKVGSLMIRGNMGDKKDFCVCFESFLTSHARLSKSCNSLKHRHLSV